MVLWGEIENKHTGLEPVCVGAHAFNRSTPGAEAKHSVNSRPACLHSEYQDSQNCETVSQNNLKKKKKAGHLPTELTGWMGT